MCTWKDYLKILGKSFSKKESRETQLPQGAVGLSRETMCGFGVLLAAFEKRLQVLWLPTKELSPIPG